MLPVEWRPTLHSINRHHFNHPSYIYFTERFGGQNCYLSLLTMAANKNQSDSEQSVMTTEPLAVQGPKPARRWWHWHEPGASKEEKWLIFKLDAAILTYTCLV